MKTRNGFMLSQKTATAPKPSLTEAPSQNLDKIMNTIQNSEWEVIKILGSGQAAFASRIYRILNVSGTMFKKKVKRLMESELVGMKVAKIRKNRMNYYFLTGLGERVFEKAFAKSTKSEKIDIDNIVKSLTMEGWRCSVQGSILTIKKAERTLRISLETSLDRKEVLKSIGDFCFLCSSETVKNLVIQKAAKTSAELSKGITIFASTVQEFEDTGELEQIEFI
jgi:predicted transcriptional regulator